MDPWDSHPKHNHAKEQREDKHNREVRKRVWEGDSFTFQLFLGPGTFRAVVLKGSPASLALCKMLKPEREVTRPAPNWLGAFSYQQDLGEL